MLRDVLGAFLDTATEREFDGPLIALLTSRGLWDIHFLHGQFEFGKDFIAKGNKRKYKDLSEGDPGTWATHQFSLQSKAGDLNLSKWQAVRLQLDSARRTTLSHPSFDSQLERSGVLILTGRLVGGAAIEAQDYRKEEQRDNRPDIEVWDREKLLSWLVDAPDVGLAGTSDGPLLALAGAIDARKVTYRALERHGRSWLPPAPGSLAAATTSSDMHRSQRLRSLVEAAVLVNRLRVSERLDLAALTALNLLRAGWVAHLANPSVIDDRPEIATVAMRLFVGVATEILFEVEPVAANPRAFLTSIRQHPVAYAAYPAACARVAEILGLLGLLIAQLDNNDPLVKLTPDANRVFSVVDSLLSSQPGCSHIISDSFAVSLISPTLLIGARDPHAAALFLTRAAVWIADRYDKIKDGIGLASIEAEPPEEVAQLLGGIYEHGPNDRRSSYAATVVLDLSTVVGNPDNLYSEILNEFLAVDLMPQHRIASEDRAQWRPDGAGLRLIPQVPYREPLSDSAFAAPHHEESSSVVPPWDALALASVVRDRHVVSVFQAIISQLKPPPN